VRSRSAVEIDLVGKFAPIEEPVGTELMLLLSEALLNVERHSGADRASVSVMHEHGRLEIRVSDNGRGLGDSREGHGMRGMRERAEWIGASIRIDSSTSGTSIAVTLEGEH
jgi:two-component system sensor histidine kinase UhpB